MKNGLIHENGKIIYYEDGIPKHKGVIKYEDNIYYIKRNGEVAVGQHAVHRSMSNGILLRGVYTFNAEGKLISGSYVSPAEDENSKKHADSKKSQKKKRSVKKVKNQTNYAVLAIFSAIVIAVAALAVYSIRNHNKPLTNQNITVDDANKAPESTKITVTTDFSTDVVLCSKSALMLYNDEKTLAEAVKSGKPYAPLTFKYSISGSDDCTLNISENEDMSDSRSLKLEAANTFVSIDNLKTATKYYYSIVSSDGNTLQNGQFKTAASTRFLNITGASNVRDIGGYLTENGSSVRQGLIIRGSELDGLSVSSDYISADTAKKVEEELGFVTEIDLRSGNLTDKHYVSRLGENVKYISIPSPAATAIFNEAYHQSIKSFFAALADESNYPVYMHCSYGASITGTMTFLLQSVLGMSEDDMIREYRLSGFDIGKYTDSTEISGLINSLSGYEGNTVAEKAVSFLIQDCGVTREQINTIRDIMLAN